MSARERLVRVVAEAFANLPTMKRIIASTVASQQDLARLAACGINEPTGRRLLAHAGSITRTRGMAADAGPYVVLTFAQAGMTADQIRQAIEIAADARSFTFAADVIAKKWARRELLLNGRPTA